MSNKLSMPALDKTEKKLNILNATLARYEKRAEAAGIPVATLMNAILDDHVKNDPFTPEIKHRVDELYEISLQKRIAKKARAK